MFFESKLKVQARAEISTCMMSPLMEKTMWLDFQPWEMGYIENEIRFRGWRRLGKRFCTVCGCENIRSLYSTYLYYALQIVSKLLYFLPPGMIWHRIDIASNVINRMTEDVNIIYWMKYGSQYVFWVLILKESRARGQIIVSDFFWFQECYLYLIIVDFRFDF